MSLTERLDGVVELAHQLKEDWVRSDPKDNDLAIYLHFYRGEEIVAAVQCPLDKDTALHAGGVGAMGFNASTMSITFESYHSTLEKSPITGEKWKPQEMQYVAETHTDEAYEKEWVWPCLTTTIHERGGEYMLRSQPYRIEDKELTWLVEHEVTISSAEQGEHGAGYMFDYLQQAMANPTMEEQIAVKLKTDPVAQLMSKLVSDEEIRLFHSDMATFRTLEERDLIASIVFSADPGTAREEMLRDRFGDPDDE